MPEKQLDLDTESDESGVVYIGWDSISVYLNGNGDICISQYNPVQCEDAVIVIPALYCDAVLREIKRASHHG